MADRPGSPRARRAVANLVALTVLVALAAGLVLWQRPWTSEGGDPALPPFPAEPAAALVAQLTALSVADSAEAFREAAGPADGAAALADRVWSARQTLDVRDVRLRRVSGGDAPDAADGSTSVLVEASWVHGERSPLGAADRTTARLRLRVVPVAGQRFALRSVEPDTGPLPLWWAGDVAVAPGPDVTLVRIGAGGVPNLERTAAAARAAVAGVVPGTGGRLVVVDPTDAAGAAALLGRPRSAVAGLAAVATALPGTAPLVVLQPQTLRAGDARSRQVVLSHEATHVLTGAVGSAGEPWVLEGFADYVALRQDPAPLAVSAGRALDQVRATGPPAALPTAQDLAGGAGDATAAYELAWLAFRALAEDRGEAAVVAFAEAVRTGADVDAAGLATLGLDRAGITALWRDRLRAWALT